MSTSPRIGIDARLAYYRQGGITQYIYHLIRELARLMVFKASGLQCSVGVSGDKTTAKYAAKLHKPDGMTVIEPWRAGEVLANAPVTDLCGIGKGIGRYLAERGVHTCGDMVRQVLVPCHHRRMCGREVRPARERVAGQVDGVCQQVPEQGDQSHASRRAR